MVFSSGLAHGSPPKHRQPAADETTPLLPGRRASAPTSTSTRVVAPGSSSGASSLTISSLDDDSEGFVPWYADVERAAAAKKTAAAATVRDVGPVIAPDAAAATPPTSDDEAAAAHRRVVLRVVAILVVGMFTYNADGSLVLATHPTIASEFNDLADSSWLFTAFALAGAATQAIVCSSVWLTRMSGLTGA